MGRRDLSFDGFLAIGNHGIPHPVIETACNKARAFFSLPAEIKQHARAPYDGYPYGYLGPELEALAKSRGVDTPPDLKESFNGEPQQTPEGIIDPQALGFCYAETIWPQAPDGFKQAWIDYYRAMEDLAERIMRLFAVALSLPKAFFQPYIDQPISALRALNYPEQSQPPKPGQQRAGGAYRLRKSDDTSAAGPAPEGWKSRSRRANGSQCRRSRVAFVINVGDLMALWTNDRWVSTLHRVVNLPPQEGGLERRQSFAFFHQAELGCRVGV